MALKPASLSCRIRKFSASGSVVAPNSAYENDIKADLYRFQETLTQMGENVTAAAGILSGSDSDAEAGARHLGVRF